MAWVVKFDPDALEQFRKLERSLQRRIQKFIETRLETTESPRRIGEALKGPLRTFWKYRIGDHRLICDIRDDVVTVLVVKIGRRDEVYR